MDENEAITARKPNETSLVSNTEKNHSKDETTEVHSNMTHSLEGRHGAKIVLEKHPGKDALDSNVVERVVTVLTI